MKATQIHTLVPFDAQTAASDKRFDGLIRLARRHFGLTVAFIAQVGPEGKWSTPCNGFSRQACQQSFCAHAVLSDEVLVVPDTVADERFCDHRLVIGTAPIRFYAGCPLITSNGNRVGVFCLLDIQPRKLNDEQLEFLSDLGSLAAAIVERDLADAQLKSQENLLRERERRMALAIEGSGTGIWDRNVETNEIYYSTSWKAILGYSDSEVSNLIADSYTRVHPADLAYVQATIQAHFDQKTPVYEVEHRLRCKDGSYKWVSSRGKVVSRDSAGKPLRMTGTTTDITAMRTMSERLQDTVDLITSLTNEVPGLVFQYIRLPGGQSFFSYASAGIRDIYEVDPEQVAASTAVLDKIIHPDDLLAYHASLDASAVSLTPWHLEYRVRLPAQGLRWRQGDARPQRLDDGSILWHGFITDVTERKRIEAELHEFATIDFLTQLPNRRHFMVQIEAEFARIQRDNSKSVAVLMIDLDHFKLINDKWGHAVGDSALRHFAAILRAQLRKTDVAGRLGGEEFAVMLCAADFAQAVIFAQRLQRRMAETPLLEADQRIAITASVGVAVMDKSDAGAGSVLSRCDLALYGAKAGGRNRIECLDQIQGRSG
ncbi:MAG TPA: diguanylate cyclase [Eoetvoesiella sp.]